MRYSDWKLTILALLAGCVMQDARAAEPASTSAGETYADETYALELEAWRQARHERLATSDGWFSLVGLFWLQEGDNRCGSDPSSTVRLPESAPAEVGVLRMSGGRVELEARPGTGLTVNGEKRLKAVLATDAEGDPTIVEIGSIRFHLIDRGGRVGVRVKDSRSPALLAFHGLESYPLDSRWRTEARFIPYDPPRLITVPTVLGTIDEQPSPGAVEFRMAAHSHRLDVLPGGDGEVFIVFGDATNGKETYGGGRFLYAEEADENGVIVLDFNKAYNPPCAFTPYATCPLPPRQNRLPLAVRAGEKKYAGGVEHR